MQKDKLESEMSVAIELGLADWCREHQRLRCKLWRQGSKCGEVVGVALINVVVEQGCTMSEVKNVSARAYVLI